MSSRFSVLSTFSGCGGSSLGYQMAGGKVLLAVEWDNNAVETYRLNFSDTPIYHGDICKLSVDECLRLAGIEPGQLDILDGSPPCQGFSTAGKRNMSDSRNQLFREYVRLLRGLQPKVFVMENVSGMVKGKMKVIFAEIMRELKASGYQVKCRLMNAMYYGVPQSRQRVIFIGVRNDLGIEPKHPNPQTAPQTVKQAFDGVTDTDAPELPEWFKKAAREMDAGNYNHQSVLKAFLKYKGTKGGSMNTKCLSWNRHSCTLPKMELTQCCIIHPDRQRRLSIQEFKRLASFPDGWQFAGDRTDVVARIGNSVPPLFMKAIAEHIRDNILAPTSALQEKG